MKQAPSGSISLSHFVSLYARFFPFGDAAPFAGLVFRAFDVNESGAIEFDEYVRVLSITSRGRLEEKLQCTYVLLILCHLSFATMLKGAFDFYDLDGDGRIGRDELTVVVSAIYRMLHGCAPLTFPLSFYGASSTASLPPQPSGTDAGQAHSAQKDTSMTTPEERVEQILQEMDRDGDGYIDFDDFRTGAQAEPSVLQGLLLYDGLV